MSLEKHKRSLYQTTIKHNKAQTMCSILRMHSMEVIVHFSMMTSSNGNIFCVTGHLWGNSAVTGEFPAQRPAMRSFDVFFDIRLNKQLRKQWWDWWFETPSRPLWHHCIYVYLNKIHDIKIMNDIMKTDIFPQNSLLELSMHLRHHNNTAYKHVMKMYSDF